MKIHSLTLLSLVFTAFSAQSWGQQTAGPQHRAPDQIVSFYESTKPIEWKQDKDVISGCYIDQPEICTVDIGDIEISSLPLINIRMILQLAFINKSPLQFCFILLFRQMSSNKIFFFLDIVRINLLGETLQ